MISNGFWDNLGYLIKNDNLNRRSGVSNITNSLRFIIDKFYFGGSWIYRPELDVYDRYDSNSNDGRIADPSKLYGLNNQIIQDQILSFVSNDPAMANIVYQSITSQKIVRNLFVIEIGYRTIF
ncbi:hypothetical protein [Leptospira sp. GIMC2001]|uniref:hypothetical protein n=1 Tax=Leptospira sp. GIMC2001 TaxID=1513297 RepID=UPI00234A4F2E|nr:hypothetical protein [Leptospira sp. GIMC2001]WCL50854.1 hypothetical protein O4O04_08585 [Leptospira sp. GIMC2001]